jgi:hypothetical protein
MKHKYTVYSSCGEVYLDEQGNIIGVGGEDEMFHRDGDALELFEGDYVFAFDIDEYSGRIQAFTVNDNFECHDWREDTIKVRAGTP